VRVRIDLPKHRLIAAFTLGEDSPRNQCAFESICRSIGSTCAQQGFVREWTRQTDPIERALSEIELGGPQREGTEHEIRLVSNRERRAITAPQAAHLVELVDGALYLAGLQQRDPEVVPREPSQLVRALDLSEDFDRLGRPTRGKVDAGPQELDVVRDGFRRLPADLLEDVERVSRLSLVEVDLCEAIGSFVSNRLGDIAFEHRLDGSSGSMVHAVVEFEVTD